MTTAGWDIGVGEIAVDTEFGAPHFDPNYESESYLHDGDALLPNAIADDWVARINTTRRDYTHQVETEYSEIIRHVVNDGGPDDYFWEVRDKDGGVRWYGATPDSGGPVPSTTDSVPTLDEEAVVRNADGNIVRWLLSAERDIGVNLIRYEYEKVIYKFGTGGWEEVVSCDPAASVCGEHHYLDRILYTDATSVITDFNGPPYEIDFIRETEMPGSTGLPVRDDPVVNARLGYVDVIADRLARIDVKHGDPPLSGTTRVYGEIAARYSFAYTDGWFGKSLLSTITQGVNDPHVHNLTYHNDLGPVSNTVAGFAGAANWNSTDDIDTEVYLDEDAEISTLGGSETHAGSGNIYIGFNPVAPSKTGSFGAGLELGGSATNSLAEWIDLNGDNLPDKVFLTGSGVSFRLNTSGPSGVSGDAFSTGTAGTANGLPGLSKDSDFSFQISAEAYPIVALGVGTGLSFSWSNNYFTDVNADGLVDFVSNGTVWFNHLVAGVPTFSANSNDTLVPLDPASLPAIDSSDLDDLDATFAAQSPPIDTVRRWIAPFSGTVDIDAPVALDVLGSTTSDGVRVAIQHNGTEVDSDELFSGGPTSAFPTTITRSVSPGDRIYFRLGAIEDGVADSVEWAPTIAYTGVSWGTDANGLSQTTYVAGDDFTLAGRPDDTVAMPFDGTVQVHAAITIGTALTDDVELVVVRHEAFLNGSDEVETTPVEISRDTITRGTTGLTNVSSTGITVDVTEATTGSDADGDGSNDVVILADRIEVYLAADSPVDLSQIDWEAAISYSSNTDAGDDDAAAEFEYQVRPHTEFYPNADPTDAAATTSLPNTFTARLEVDALAGDTDPTVAIITFKNSNGIVKVTQQITDGGNVEFNVDLSSIAGADYFVDISVRDGAFSRDGLLLTHFDRETAPDTWTAIDSTLRWTGLQGIFPLAYRGWAAAGYTAAGADATSAMVESAFDIDADPDAAVSEPQREDISLDEPSADPSYAFVPAQAAGSAIPVEGGSTQDSEFGTVGDAVPTDRWIGPRSSIYADDTTMQTSRLVADAASITDLGAGGMAGAGGRTAPTRLSIGGPGLTLLFGVGPLGASAGLSPSWGITDFEDMNGDGYPDVVSAGSVTYTNQIGGYIDTATVDGTSVTNQDLTFSISGGLDTGLVDIVPNAKGSTNANNSNSSGNGDSASDSGPAYSLGVSGNGGFSWSSPNASTDSSEFGDQQTELQGDADDTGGVIQRAFADVNGDGLPDRVYTDGSGVFAFYNLGYGFTAKAVQLGSGGFESRESASGGFGLGFSLPYGEFGGGVNFQWNYDWSRYGWRDVNGDGILDQLHLVDDDTVEVRFGTGSGLLGPIDYGDFANVPIPGLGTSGQEIAFDQSTGIGGGASATGYIGPLCLVACYLVIGGGGGYNNSRSTSSIEVEDANGDGYADVLESLNDNLLKVSENKQGRTNLLASVANPLGGSFAIDYTRDGNTTDHPDSVWVMSELTRDDGRDNGVGDGDDTTRQTFTYSGLGYDRVHRDSLGYSFVVTTEHGNAGAVIESTEHTYLNDHVFEAGLLTEVKLKDADGNAYRGSTVSWGFRDLAISTTATPEFPLGGVTGTVASRGRSITPLITEHSEYWYESDGTTRTFERVKQYTYDGLGNRLTEVDQGAAGTVDDNLITTFEYSNCMNSTSNGCLATAGHSNPSPLADTNTCVNWASYPGRVTVEDHSGTVLREREGLTALCDNGAVTVENIVVSDGGTPATTEMTVNQYGDYELIMGPPGADGDRYTVRYTYDADRHSDVALVEEFDVANARTAIVLANGPDPAFDEVGISSSATFDPLSGRVASRTDANGATRHYAYDELGRMVEISRMTTGGGAPTPLITFEYDATDAVYAHAIARHVDDFDGNATPDPSDPTGGDTSTTIDTITFVDGFGRVTQTKRDARIQAPGELQPRNTRQVTGAVSFDEWGLPDIEYGPVADDSAARSFTTAAFGGKQTTYEYDPADRILQITEPGARITTYEYAFEDVAEDTSGLQLHRVLGTDPEGRQVLRGADIRSNERVHVDYGDDVTLPDKLPTTFDVNPIGETLEVVGPIGETTTFTYDLRGNQLSVVTPNSGETTFAWDLAGRRSEMVNERMRANGAKSEYRYDLDRLVEVDHPGVVDDVTYEWGLDNGDGRYSAGRIRHIEDRTRLADNSYDSRGALTGQLVEVKRHNWDPTLTEPELEEFRYTTEWTYDELGRIETIRYPDAKTVQVVPLGTSVATLTDPSQLAGALQSVDQAGELVTYDYDSGGTIRDISGEEDGFVVGDEPINHFVEGVQTLVSVARPAVHTYDYLVERVYDHRLLAIADSMGNTTETTRVYDPNTAWLTEIVTTAADPDPAVTERVEIQDIAYTFDEVGRPLTYENDLPFANRAINGGAIIQTYNYDGFGRLVGAAGSFFLKEREEQQYTYGVGFAPSTPWNWTTKQQQDQLVTIKPNGDPGKTKVNELTTYDVARAFGTVAGPLHVTSEDRTDDDGVVTYDFTYNENGAIESMLGPVETGKGKGKGKQGEPTETHVWDRTFTYNHLDQLTSADDGSELRTFAYDDAGNLTIQDGNLLADDGTVLHESGGGPETIFLNQWVTIRAQKIYKHIWAGDDQILVKKDTDGEYESTQLYRHEDLVGSTNIVTDVQGRGFQRHEYLPSGEIWIDDRKEEIRTPFQFADGYYEDAFDIVLFGSRWYDTERELFLSPDPIIVNDVAALIDQPALGGAYTYGGANGVSNVDPSGQTFFSGHQRAQIVARAEANFEAKLFGMRLAMDDEGAQAAADSRARDKARQDRAELLETNALLVIDLNENEISFGLPLGDPSNRVLRRNLPSDAADANMDGNDDSNDGSDATRDGRKPRSGENGVDPGSTSIDITDQSEDGDVAGSGEDDDVIDFDQMMRTELGLDDGGDAGVSSVVSDSRMDD